MTEDSFQAARVVMQKANYLRGRITVAEGNVSKWTKIEASLRANLQEAKANGAKKQLEKALLKLREARLKFEALQFPDAALKNKIERCTLCGRKLEKGKDCVCIYE